MRLALSAIMCLGVAGFPEALAAQAPGAAQTVTLFILRHAERGSDDPRDPNLSEAGRRRADELARVLGDAGITGLVATEFRRTQQTLAPLAESRGIKTTVIPAGSMDSLVALIRALPAGSRAAIASHSNLVHLIVNRLTGIPVNPLSDTDYDRLFVVTLSGSGVGTAVTLRYGER